MVVAPPAPEWCVEVTPECPVEGTLYGYAPHIGANGFFAAFFFLCLVIQLVLGIKHKTWTYMIALCLGCFGEGMGYVGRIMMSNNPFSENGFMIQICCLIVAPAFVAAGIYLTLKHVVISFGQEWSRLRPAWYTYIFIAGDIISLTLQGAGGGAAASADPGTKMVDVGTNLMIAGVIFQVVVLAFFAYFFVEYAVRTYRRRDTLTADAMQLFHAPLFRFFMGAVVVAYVGIFVRCIYRIPELTSGWRSELMRNEPEFIVLEGVMIVISVAALTIFHPGYCFPALGNTIGKNKAMQNKNKEMRGKNFDGHETSDAEMTSGHSV